MLEKLAIDFQRKEPIYYQIEEQIRFLIASGQILPGEQLPAVREMAEALDVNFNTIARVYRRLDHRALCQPSTAAVLCTGASTARSEPQRLMLKN